MSARRPGWTTAVWLDKSCVPTAVGRLQSIDSAIAKGVYAPVDLREYRDELNEIFPTGVCDYSLGDAARPPDLRLN